MNQQNELIQNQLVSVPSTQVRLFEARQRQTHLGHFYWTARVANHKGSIDAVFLPQCTAKLGELPRGMVIDATGTHNTFTHVWEIEYFEVTDPSQMGVSSLLLKEWACIEVHEALARLVCLLDTINEIPLQRFIVDVLIQQEVSKSLLTFPASNGHHHSYKGGLLVHTVEVMEILDREFEIGSSRWERDLSLVMALVHDLGKILTSSCSTAKVERGYYQSHEMATLELLAEPLRRLETLSEISANHLRAVFNAPDFYPRRSIGLLKRLRQADRKSARSRANPLR